MNIYNIILFLLGYAVAWFAVIRYDIHMFQQNSYREERYLRWLKGNWRVSPTWLLVVLAICSLIPAIESEYPIASLILLGGIAWLELRKRYKTPLVYTMRVKRLLLSSLLITVCVVTVMLILAPRFMPSVALLMMVTPIVMLLANTLNKPIEAAISRWYYNDAKRILTSMPELKIIGITGSFGKTSTKHYLHRILSEKYNVLMTPGNFNTTLGVVRTIREHLKPHHQVFIVEMGAKQRGDIKEICDLVHPSIGIVTAVGEMHLETFHTVENIRRTKFELIDSLPKNGVGVINLDSEPIAKAHQDHHCNTISYGTTNDEAHYRAVNIDYTPAVTSFDIDIRGDIREGYTTHLAGRGNILNLVAAIAVADELGVSIAMQKRAIRQIEQIEHRLSIKRTAGGFTIIDDAYNSNPTGAKMALEVLSSLRTTPSAKRIVVTPGFVELGERQAELNTQLGRDIAAVAELTIVVNKINRQAICDGLQQEGYPQSQIVVCDSFAEASAHLTTIIKAGDVVLYENDLPDSFV